MPIRALLFASLLAASPALAQKPSETAPVLLESQADSLTRMLAGGYAVEFRSARRYHLLDAGAGSPAYAAVFFTIEALGSANDYRYWFALFQVEPYAPSGQRVRPPGYRLLDYIEIGGKGGRQVDFEKLAHAKGVFTLETDKGRALLQLEGNRLREAK